MKIFKILILLLLISFNSFAGIQSFAHSLSAYECAVILGGGKVPFQNIEELLDHATKTQSPSIIRLSNVILEGLNTSDSGVDTTPHDIEKLVWGVGEALNQLHDVISLNSEGFGESDIQSLADEITKSLSEKLAPVKIVNTKKAEVTQPTLAGAKYFSIPEVTKPVIDIFIADGAKDFNKWLLGLGSDQRKAIYNRLKGISENNYFGNHTPIESEFNLSSTRIYKLLFWMSSGPRIYYFHYNNSIIIIGYGIASEGGISVRNSDYKKAAVIANEFLRMQKI